MPGRAEVLGLMSREEGPVERAEEGEPCRIRTGFVRHRNVLLVQGDLGPLYVDYYLHLAEHGLEPAREVDAIFRRGLAAFALHCAARPRNELVAWTVSIQRPLLNLFYTADNELGTIAGRAFTENVKEAPENRFFCDVVRGREPLRRSVVGFEGSDPWRAVEAYHEQSEQRPARYFDVGGDEVALLASHPDWDESWFHAVDAASVKTIPEREHVQPIETRGYRWKCGCNEARIHGVLASAMVQDADGLFGGEETLQVQCPRCAARYLVTREALEAYVARNPGR